MRFPSSTGTEDRSTAGLLSLLVAGRALFLSLVVAWIQIVAIFCDSRDA